MIIIILLILIIMINTTTTTNNNSHSNDNSNNNKASRAIGSPRTRRGHPPWRRKTRLSAYSIVYIISTIYIYSIV